MKNLAPQIETEDMKIIGELENIPDRVISTVSQGVSIMIEYFGLENTHEEAKAKYTKNSKTAGIIVLIPFGIALILCFCVIFIEEFRSGFLANIAGHIVMFGMTVPLVFGFSVSLILDSGIIRDVNVRGKNILCLVSFKKDLMAVCDKMNMDWHTTGLDESGQIRGGSTFIAGGIAGLAVSGIFAAGQYAYGKHEKKQLKIISNIVSYCQIAEYFNQTYHPE